MGLRILVVDDEKLSRETTAFQLSEAGHVASAHETPFTALTELGTSAWDVVLTDLRMPSMNGLEFLKEIRSRSPGTAVLIMTAHATVATAVEAMRAGAIDYLTKPFEFDELNIRLDRVAEIKEMKEENASLRTALGTSPSFCGLIGTSSVMHRVSDLIGQFASLPSNVLIVGETGTGKELVARAIHMRSANAKGPFVAVGCAAVPKDLAESELFGHEAGAFTGATKTRKGRVELAFGGTLFLDDVDDLPMELQAKLLRVIQERQFERVGGEKSISANIRIVAASKVDLETIVKQGRFRDDLMYRLSVLVIPVAPLRERREDILLLCQHFLSGFARERNAEPKALSRDAIDRLQCHPWPGNIRELRHAMEYAIAVSRTDEIRADDLPPKFKLAAARKTFDLHLEGQEHLNLKNLTGEFEHEVIQWALEKGEGNQGRAAQILGLPRSTLQFKINEYKSKQG